MSERFLKPTGRGRCRVFSLSPRRVEYLKAGEPYGKNRKAVNPPRRSRRGFVE